MAKADARAAFGKTGIWRAVWRWLRRGVLAGVLVLLGIVALTQMRTPSHDRDWRAEIAVMPKIERTQAHYTIDQVRDWTYSADEIVQNAYHQGTYKSDDLVGTWLMVEPFGGSDAIAHTLILFEFSNGRLLALTIEARKEKGEIYSALKGGFNTYELIYLWAEARDVLTRRARFLRHDVFVYPVDLSKEERIAFFEALVEKTNQLYQTPRFYNTLFSNCTNELAKTAGLKWNMAFFTTGYAPNHLYKVGLIPGQAENTPFETLKQAGDVTDLVASARHATPEEFDVYFLKAIKARFRGLQAGSAR